MNPDNSPTKPETLTSPKTPTKCPSWASKAFRYDDDVEYPLRPAWPKGPWDNEPDRVEWFAEGLDYPLLILRNRFGALCGYAAVPPGHPLHGASASEAEEAGISAHGGLTWSSDCNGEICHVPRPGEPDNVWWFGFDCLHAFDVAPGMCIRESEAEALFKRENMSEEACDALTKMIAGRAERLGDYRDLEWVRVETEMLAKQLADAAKPKQDPEPEPDAA